MSKLIYSEIRFESEETKNLLKDLKYSINQGFFGCEDLSEKILNICDICELEVLMCISGMIEKKCQFPSHEGQENLKDIQKSEKTKEMKCSRK